VFCVLAVLLVPLHLIGSYWFDGGPAQLWWALLGTSLAATSSAEMGRV
jgi:hypothetical protein